MEVDSKPSNDDSKEKPAEQNNPFAGSYNLTINNRRPPLFAIQFPELFVC